MPGFRVEERAASKQKKNDFTKTFGKLGDLR